MKGPFKRKTTPPPVQAPTEPGDDYAETSHAMADYAREITEARKADRGNAGKIVGIVFLVLVLLAGIGGGVYWFMNRPKSEPKKTSAQTTQPKTTNKIDATTKHLSSTEFIGLEFDYPADWTVGETTGSGRLTVTSLALPLKDASGQTVTGQVVLTIRNKQQALPEFDGGNGVAARESQKINYTKPSSSQRGSTYLSFVRYAKNSNDKALDGVYVTGDTGYQVGQAVPKADFTPVDPVISLTFDKCANSSCSGQTSPLSIAASEWDDTQFARPLTTMLQSLVVN